MNKKLHQSTLWLLGLGIFLSSTGLVRGQETVALANVLLEIWPEYDRAETLVIYQGQLSEETPLPVRLTFALPGYIEAIHVVAAEREGRLFEIDPAAIMVSQEEEATWLTFSSPGARFQFEYYDPLILQKEEQTRLLDFQFSPSYPIDTIVFEVQEPLDAAAFSMTPPADDSFTGADGLQYHTIRRGPLTPADTFELSATYQRQTDELSAPNLTTGSPAAPTLEAVSTETTATDLRLGYLLVGVGLVLLLIAGGAWLWTQRRPPPQTRRPPRKGGRAAARRRQTAGETGPAPVPQEGNFCYRCGASLRPEANFCHNCGAKRRYK